MIPQIVLHGSCGHVRHTSEFMLLWLANVQGYGCCIIVKGGYDFDDDYFQLLSVVCLFYVYIMPLGLV